MKNFCLPVLTFLLLTSTPVAHSQPVTGTTPSGMSFNSFQNGSLFDLFDSPRNIKTGAIIPSGILYTDNNNLWTETTDPLEEQQMIAAHVNAERVYDYWSTEHSRNGVNGLGVRMDILVNNNGPNASNPSSTLITCGNGSNAYNISPYYTSFNSFTAIDIIAHEYTHGIIHFACGLGTGGEPGSINEAICDYFAIAIKNYPNDSAPTNWKFGEGIIRVNNQPVAIRYLNDPKYSAVPVGLQNYLSAYYPLAQEIGDDNWQYYPNDVYVHSGPMSYALYLISEGGQGVTGIGFGKTSKIIYRALTSGELNSTSGYVAVKNALLNAAENLYGASTEFVSIGKAFILIKIGVPSQTTKKISVLNNFGSGDLKVDGSKIFHGESINDAREGTYHSIEATDQYDNLNRYQVWNSQGNNLSVWKKKLPLFPETDIQYAGKRIYGMMVKSDMDNSLIRSDHKLRFDVKVDKKQNSMELFSEQLPWRKL